MWRNTHGNVKGKRRHHELEKKAFLVSCGLFQCPSCFTSTILSLSVLVANKPQAKLFVAKYFPRQKISQQNSIALGLGKQDLYRRRLKKKSLVWQMRTMSIARKLVWEGVGQLRCLFTVSPYYNNYIHYSSVSLVVGCTVIITDVALESVWMISTCTEK